MQCGVPCPGPSSAPPEGCHSSATLEVAGLPSQWQQPRPPHPINTSSSAMASNFICCILHLKHWPPETFLLIIAPDRHQATFGGGERALISERRNLPLTACTTIMRDGNTDQKKRKQCNRHRVVPLDAITAGGARHIRSQTVIVFSPSVRGKAAYCSSHPPQFPSFYCPATF